MDNITKSVISVLSVAGAMAFLTPSGPAIPSKNTRPVNSVPPKPLAPQSNFEDDEDLEAVEEDNVAVDEDGNVIEDSDDSDWNDDVDLGKFGEPTVGFSDDKNSSKSEADLPEPEDNIPSANQPANSPFQPSSGPSARWQGRTAPAN